MHFCYILNFAFFFKEADTCNNPPSEKKARYSEGVLMQAARPSIIKYAGRITHDLDHPTSTQLIVTEPSNPSVSSTQAGRKLKREWAASHNASTSSDQDRRDTPLQAIPETSDVQPELVNVYIFFLIFSKK